MCMRARMWECWVGSAGMQLCRLTTLADNPDLGGDSVLPSASQIPT
jgi:hypothetical protein